MRRTMLLLVAVLMLSGIFVGAAIAADNQKLSGTGINYTKFLWGNRHYDGSMYNFTTIPGEGYGDNGQGTEFELLFASRPSSKIEVNGPGRHPLYAELTAVPDAAGEAGDIQWNFEKFLVGPDGEVIARFRPMTEPEDQEVVSAIEANLPR